MSGPVTVIGIDGRPLPRRAAERLAAATLVVGGARHLESVAVPQDAERVVLGDVPAGLARLEAHPGPAVVLASGDPGFFGIVRMLIERGIEIDVIAAAGSVATVCGSAGVSWDDATVISAHGRGPLGLRRAVNACRALPKVVVLTAPGSGPAELGAALAGVDRSLIVGERLGSPSEMVTRCTPAEASTREWSEPNVVLVLGAVTAGRGWAFPARRSPAGWGVAEAEFEHRDAMVTKAEVRALALARLGPGLGDLIWDLGAGSGSVGIECARFGAAVIAVDSDEAQCDRVARNAEAFGVEVEVVYGQAPDVLAGLPDPDGVFVGGGGADIRSIIAAAATRHPRTIVVTLAAIERVGPAVEALRKGGYETGGVQLSASRLADLPGEMTRLAAQNPVFVIWGHTEAGS